MFLNVVIAWIGKHKYDSINWSLLNSIPQTMTLKDVANKYSK